MFSSIRPAAFRALATKAAGSRNLTVGRRQLHVGSSLSSTAAVNNNNTAVFNNTTNNAFNNNIRFFSDNSKTEEPKKEETLQEEIAEAQAEGASNNNNTDELETLQQQVQDLKDQLLRSLAEQENIRQIAKNDVAAANQFAIKKFAKSLLEVADNLDRALENVEDHNSPFYQGIALTQQGLVKALEANGCVEIPLKPGDAFDPTLHSALMEYQDHSLPPGSVGQIIKKGYLLNNRVLRPAEVGVVKK